MKLHFNHLHKLSDHVSFLSDVCGIQGGFVVGGVVRDLLLGHKTTIDDVDMTMRGEPDVIRKQLQHTLDQKGTKQDNLNNKISIFRTEKFGTMSIVRSLGNSDDNNKITYEITPFREESGYADNRHPEKIIWSQDLLADAGRRDFTINCLYFSLIPNGKIKKNNLKITTHDSNKDTIDGETLMHTLSKKGYTIIDDIIVIQDYIIIQDLLPNGVFSLEKRNNYITSYQIKEHINGILRDPYKGIDDLVYGKIQCVGDPTKRISEDALRILRALRFQNMLNFHPLLNGNFDFGKETWMSMKKYYFLIKTLSKERIHEEIKKVFSGPNPFGYIALLDELNILKYIFPHIMDIKHLNQPVRFHPFDVYSHTLLALHHLQSINTNWLVKIAMLYHDVGKSEQYYTHSFSLGADDRSFIYGGRLNHINCGQDMAREDLELIGFSNKEIEEVVWYIGYHMKPGEILMSKKENWKKRMRELYTQGGYQKVCNLLDICRGDRRGHFNPIQKPNIDDIDQLQTILNDLQNQEGQFTPKQLAVNGNDIMREFNLPAGKQIGELLDKIFSRVLDDVKGRNTIGKIMTWLKKEIGRQRD